MQRETEWKKVLEDGMRRETNKKEKGRKIGRGKCKGKEKGREGKAYV